MESIRSARVTGPGEGCDWGVLALIVAHSRRRTVRLPSEFGGDYAGNLASHSVISSCGNLRENHDTARQFAQTEISLSVPIRLNCGPIGQSYFGGMSFEWP